MKTPSFEDSQLLPLTTDADVERRVAALIGRACRRQLWLLFLDDHNVQLPLLIPIDNLPTRPEPAGTALLARTIAHTMDETEARAVIIVIERYGDEALTSADTDWAGMLHTAFDRQNVTVRAILLSHRAGVRWLAADDYRF